MDNPTQSENSDTERTVLREYYLENDFFLSTEGILKVLSIMVCTSMSMSLVWGGWCGKTQAAGGAGGAALCAAALLSTLSAARALTCAAQAPMTCFIIDMILSTVIGVSLLMLAVLSLTLCETKRVLDYIYAPLALINSALVISSAVITYVTVSMKWDAVSGLRDYQPNSITDELEV